MVRDALVRYLQIIGTFQIAFIEQKKCEPLVHAFKNHLFDKPHNITETRRHNRIRIVCKRRRFLHDFTVNIRRYKPKSRIFFRLKRYFKLNIGQHTRSRQQTYIALKQAKQSYFLSFVRCYIRAKLPFKNRYNAYAVRIAVMQNPPFRHIGKHRLLLKLLPVFFAQPVPRRKIVFKMRFHGFIIQTT